MSGSCVTVVEISWTRGTGIVGWDLAVAVMHLKASAFQLMRWATRTAIGCSTTLERQGSTQALKHEHALSA
jgi:hypothetical protein